MDITIKLLNALIAIVAGVLGAMLLYWALNKLVERLPGRLEDRVKPYVFIGPAVLLVGLFLIYPAIRTMILSFANSTSTEWVGTQNYTRLLGSDGFRSVLGNTLLWMLVVPTMSVALGLVVAVLADRLNPRGEKLSKSLIFMPMAISMVGASAIWQIIYQSRPAGVEQTGLLNAIVVGLGGEPQAWLQFSQFKINSLLLMVIMIWLQAGFAMVLLSAAIKGVPEDTIEAGRIDGASELAIFFRIVVPQIWPTVITVFVTVLIGVMKVFDIVYVMTGGRFNTDVVANQMYLQAFQFFDEGRGSVLAVVLFLAVLPMALVNVRNIRKQGMAA